MLLAPNPGLVLKKSNLLFKIMEVVCSDNAVIRINLNMWSDHSR